MVSIIPLSAATRRRGNLRTAASALLLLASGAVVALVRWQARARERRVLRWMDDRALRDVGLNRADVERESGRSFWRF